MLLEVDRLNVRFATESSTVHAVTDANLRIHRGEILGVVGETGSGKSTVVRAIGQLLPRSAQVSAKAIRFDGQELLGMPRSRLRRLRGDRIAFIPQNPFGALNPTMKIRRQFKEVLRAHGRTGRGATEERAHAMLGHVGIREPQRVLSGYAHELSGGMAQRVVIALALALDPELVLADEPTTGLDVTIQRQLLELIVAMTRESGRSTMLVTHDIGVVAQFCDRVAVMYAGQMLEVGSVERVLTEPAHPYTKALLDAVPRRGHEVKRLPGSMPSLREEPAQRCVFYDRCAVRADARCEVERPLLREVGPGHLAATFCSNWHGDGAKHVDR